jgi:hypothetical protein
MLVRASSELARTSKHASPAPAGNGTKQTLRERQKKARRQRRALGTLIDLDANAATRAGRRAERAHVRVHETAFLPDCGALPAQERRRLAQELNQGVERPVRCCGIPLVEPLHCAQRGEDELGLDLCVQRIELCFGKATFAAQACELADAQRDRTAFLAQIRAWRMAPTDPQNTNCQTA